MTSATILAPKALEPLLQRNWSWLLLRGVLAIALGTVAFLFPANALFAFTLMFAAYAGADGTLSQFAGIRGGARSRDGWVMPVLRGILGIAVAVLFVVMPFEVTLGYAAGTLALLSVWAIATGLLEIAAAIRLRNEIKGEWLLGLSGLLSLLLGLAVPALLYMNPPATILSVAWLIGGWAVIAGVVLIGLALRLRRRRGGHESPSLQATTAT